jgi:hypothetical protein
VELTYRLVSVILGSVDMVWVVVVKLFWPSAAAGFFLATDFFLYGLVQSAETFVFLWLGWI